jgi:hypothetical protein
MVRPARFERAAPALGGRCSIHLSYGRVGRTHYCIVAAVARQPFVWQVQVRREMVEDEIAHLRELPYGLWQETIGSPMTKVITGRDQKNYTVRVSAKWDAPGSDDIRVTVTLLGGALKRRLHEDSFVITSSNQFLR